MFSVTIAAYEDEDKPGGMPEGLDSLGLSVSTTTDPWGNPYRYVITDDKLGFDVISSGSDGIMGTDDDMALSYMDRVWKDAFENFPGEIKEFGDRMDRLQNRNANFKPSGHSVWGCIDSDPLQVAGK